MKEITKKWIDFAEADLDAANILFNGSSSKKRVYQICVLHCHQAVEKILKSYLIEQDIIPPRIHNLLRLKEIIGIKFDEKNTKFLEQLNPHYQPPRYPDLVYKNSIRKIYNKNIAKKYLIDTKNFLLWLKKEIKK